MLSTHHEITSKTHSKAYDNAKKQILPVELCDRTYTKASSIPKTKVRLYNDQNKRLRAKIDSDSEAMSLVAIPEPQ